MPSRPSPLQHPLSFSPSLPAAFDWQVNLTPVKNQGMCASCWSFVSTTVLEAYISIQSNQTPVALSTQSMVDCDLEFKCVNYWWMPSCLPPASRVQHSR